MIQSKRLLFISYAFLFLIIFCLSLVNISIGPGDLSFTKILNHLFLGQKLDSISAGMAFDLRLPRAMLATLVGASLGIAGVITQGIFHNPLAGPNILGISSGASLFVVIGIALGVNNTSLYITPSLAAAGSLCTALALYTFAARLDSFYSLLLTGLALSTLLSALVTLVLSAYIQNYEVTVQIMNWLLGSFEAKTWQHLFWGLPGIIIAIVILLYKAVDYDVLNLGNEVTATMGINVRHLYIVSLFAVALLVGTATALTGIIGFVGLIIPHVCRLLVGPMHRRLIPFAGIFGATFLLAVDILSRNILQVYLAPGVITSLIGSPIFIWLIKTKTRSKFS